MRYLPFFTTFFSLLFFLSSELGAEGFYKWTDARGNTQYSDEPPTNGKAKKMKLPPITVLENYGKQWEVTPLPKTQAQKSKVVTAKIAKPPQVRYKALNFIAPKQGQSIKATDGDVSAMLNIKPPLKKGHSLLYVLDGKNASKGVSRIANFQNLPKGSHSLMVKVVDIRGSVLQSSSALKFQIIR